MYSFNWTANINYRFRIELASRNASGDVLVATMVDPGLPRSSDSSSASPPPAGPAAVGERTLFLGAVLMAPADNEPPYNAAYTYE